LKSTGRAFPPPTKSPRAFSTKPSANGRAFYWQYMGILLFIESLILIFINMTEFTYFNEEWNDEKIKKNSNNKGRVAPCIGHAYASEEQEEIYQNSKT
tara:strand:+ start:652 stop:945 length:294 start_codon:yes stop_codon:yes gene_type:complete